MVVFIKEATLKSSKENNLPETDLLKRCTKMKASQNGKKVELLTSSDELLGTLNREDDAHCNLDITNGHSLMGRYTSTSTDKKPSWTIYEYNEAKTSKVKIIDEERARILKGLFNDIRNAAERSLKLGKDSVSFRNRNLLDNSRKM